MVLILYYNYVRCYWGLVGEGYMRHSIFAASCESITISKLKVKKNIVTSWKMAEVSTSRISSSNETINKLTKK